MPSIDRFNGIKINVYNIEHPPPHVHAIYNEYEALVEIESGNIYAGDLPVNQKRQVIAWIRDNVEWALNVFYELNPELK